MTNMKLASETQCTVVVAGDSRVGKSALIQRFVNKTFQQVYMPTSFDKSFAKHEVNKHDVHFSFWDTSGSPAYDSVRPLSYQEADVFLLCYKISDPISLYNVKNKWIRELRRHRSDVPVILCGCQSDLRSDPMTVAHLSKTGRAPVTSEQALAICCEIEALHYVETSAKSPDRDNAEAFEVCALAAIKYHNAKHSNNNNNLKSSASTFKRSPSINSTMSLFEPPQENGGGNFKRSPSTHSSLSLSAVVTTPLSGRLPFPFPIRKNVPPLNSPSSYSECDARLSTFSPEPLRVLPGPGSGPCGLGYGDAPRIPPVISENEAYQDDNMEDGGDRFGTYNNNNINNNNFHRRNKLQRPSSLCDAKQIFPNSSDLPTLPSRMGSRLQRPTTLFKSNMQQQQQSPFQSFLNNNNNNNSSTTTVIYASSNNNSSTMFTPTGDPQRRILHYYNPKAVIVEPRRFDSLSELGTPTTSTCSSEQTSPQFAAQIRPNNLGRRTSYRTNQKVSIPVATPMSPVGSVYGSDSGCGMVNAAGSECSFDMRSPPSSMCTSPRPLMSPAPMADTVILQGPPPMTSSTRIPDFESFKVYESLKSQMSTSSHGSSVSKMSFSEMSHGSDGASSSSSSSASTSSSVAPPHLKTSTLGRTSTLSPTDLTIPDTEDPELIKKLSFVSPKSGVFRPLPEGRRQRQNCSIM